MYPDNDLGFVGNFLSMMFRMAEPRYEADPALERALEVLFILHADHEQNCSANAMRAIGSSKADPYSAMAGAAAALYGPLHGGANEAVLRMLAEIGDVENVPGFVERVKAGRRPPDGLRPPRLQELRPAGEDHQAGRPTTSSRSRGRNPLLDIALELEQIALEDEYFVARKLYPNVDFYSGIIYEALGLPVVDVPGDVRHPADGGLARAVARDGRRSGAEDRAAAPAVRGPDERDYEVVQDRRKRALAVA